MLEFVVKIWHRLQIPHSIRKQKAKATLEIANTKLNHNSYSHLRVSLINYRRVEWDFLWFRILRENFTSFAFWCLIFAWNIGLSNLVLGCLYRSCLCSFFSGEKHSTKTTVNVYNEFKLQIIHHKIICAGTTALCQKIKIAPLIGFGCEFSSHPGIESRYID